MTTESGVPEPEPGRRRSDLDGHHWTKVNVRRQLRILDARLGHWPSLREYRELAERDHRLPPADDVLRVHGSWSAVRIAVTEIQRVPRLRTLHRSYMAGATARELSERTGISRDTILIAFKEAGLPTGRSSRLKARPRDKELVMIRRLAKRLGRAPTMSEYDANRGAGLVTAQALTRRSGRWRDVLEMAGVEPPR